MADLSSRFLWHAMYAGIILCGGKSSRMGHPKALLPFGKERLLQRVVRLLGEAVHPLVVVAAQNQELPDLPAEVCVVRDARDSRGPLEGLRAGLVAVAPHARMAYATACDVPLLAPAFVRHLFELSAGGRWRIVVPEAEGFKHPLAAVYSTDLVPEIEGLLEADRLRPMYLLERVSTRVVDEKELRRVDPGLATLRNVNHPEDYLAALRTAGLTASDEILRSIAQRL